MPYINPPKEVFQTNFDLRESQGGYTLNGWVKTVCPLEGGMFSYYDDKEYPFAGHPYVEAVEANNIIKKMTVAMIKSLKPGRPIKMLENVLENYCRMADYTNRIHYMKKKFYNKTSREMWDCTYFFFKHLGINDTLSSRTGRVVANLFEWDEAYRFRMQFIFSQSNWQALIDNPREELLRLGDLYASREKQGVEETFLRPIKMLSLLMIIPKVKKSFIFAVRQANLLSLQPDKADKYYWSLRGDFDFSLT